MSKEIDIDIMLIAHEALVHDLGHDTNLLADLLEYLNTRGKTPEDRMVPTVSNYDEVKFIGEYSPKEGGDYLFGTVLYMQRSEAIKIFKEQLQQPMLHLTDIEKNTEDNINNDGINNTEKSGGIMTDRYFFCLNKKYVILTGSSKTGKPKTKEFQQYINAIRAKDKPFHKIDQIVISMKDINNKKIDIKYIKIMDDDVLQKVCRDVATNSNFTSTINVFTDTKSMVEHYEDDMLEAEVKLKVKKDRDLKILLKSMPGEFLQIITKDGKKLYGTEYLERTRIKISVNAKSHIPETKELKRLEKEMMNYLNRVSNESVN